MIDFVKNIEECYSNTKDNEITMPIKLYLRLLTRISLDKHMYPKSIAGEKMELEDIFQRHIECFTEFCKANRSQILEKSTDLAQKRIVFSEQIYIDMEYVFSKSDKDGNTDTLFEYLLAILAYVDPDEKTLGLLRKKKMPNNMEEGLELIKSMNMDAPEMKQIQDAIQELAKSVDIEDMTENPMAMIGKLLQSKDFTNVVNRVTTMVENNDIDIASLVNTATTMAKNSGIDISALAGMADLMGNNSIIQSPPK